MSKKSYILNRMKNHTSSTTPGCLKNHTSSSVRFIIHARVTLSSRQPSPSLGPFRSFDIVAFSVRWLVAFRLSSLAALQHIQHRKPSALCASWLISFRQSALVVPSFRGSGAIMPSGRNAFSDYTIVGCDNRQGCVASSPFMVSCLVGSIVAS